MRDNEQLCRALINNCPDSVLLLDSAGSIRYANSAAARLHGYTLAELTAMNIAELEASADAQVPISDLLRRFQASEALRYNTFRRRKDGTLFPVEGSAAALSLDGKLLLLAFDRDIRQRTHDELHTLRQCMDLTRKAGLVTLSEMASSFTHELNQPLAALCLYSSSALELATPYDSPELQECLQRITEQLHHTNKILHRMRSFANRSSTRREPININMLIQNVMALLTEEVQRSTASTILELDKSMEPVLADESQIQLVLFHLFRNALEALTSAPGQRQLSISSQDAQNKVLVTVSDTGPGLAPTIAKRLFLPFQTTKPEGLGMGLAICRTLIEAHGGYISLQPSTGSGATFSFELPRNTKP